MARSKKAAKKTKSAKKAAPSKKVAAKAASRAKAPKAKAKVKAKVNKANAKAAPKTRARDDVPAGLGELLGQITVPSGKLAIFDVGLVGYLPRPALEPTLVTANVPADHELPVIGKRVGTGRFADCWDHVAVKLATGEITHSRKLGEAAVDFARIVFMDHAALDHWKHEDSLDGLADVVFWGRDAATAAKVLGAKRLPEGYGWTNLTLTAAEDKALEVDKRKASNKWGMAIDYRPHSHHFHVLAAARKNKQGAGMIEVGGAQVCLFFTSWGDGVFPIYLDLDGDDHPVQVRVQLSTQEALAAMNAVN